MNLNYSSELIEKLLDWGVAEFYVCAGIRNTPLIDALNNIESKNQIVFNHFEERSASFYALGRIKSLQKPVAVVVTSGTAVGELLPATMEAYYAGLPLVLLTADRPKNYRETGAPQSAEHANIFGNYVSGFLDLEVNDPINLNLAKYNRPFHINVCFDAPYNTGSTRTIFHKEKVLDANINITTDDLLKSCEVLANFIKSHKKTLIIVSKLKNNSPALLQFLKNENLPIYIESISNIREHPELNSLKIKCADKLWVMSKESGYQIDSVIKIGGTPTHRIWRDLDEKRKDLKVISISEDKFPGMPNAINIETNLEMFFGKYNQNKYNKQNSNNTNFLELDSCYYQKLIDLINKYPNAEQSWYYHLSNKFKDSTNIYLGNSLPIRYWDLSASYENQNFNIEATRGLNGIDGQISTFLGYAQDYKENYGVFGDLTTMYDLSALWMLQHRPKLKVNICIINNSGGQIFKNLVNNSIANLVINKHQNDFSAWANFWKVPYQLLNNPEQFSVDSNTSRIIEIRPCDISTNNFHSEWLSLE